MGGSADRGGRHGRGDVEDRVLHPGPQAGSRNPVLLARQVGSVANLIGNRFGFGVGIGWAPEEFEWCGVPYKKRGARVDEMIDVIKLILGGGMVEYHGEFFDFDRLQMSPARRSRCRSTSADTPTSRYDAPPGWATAGRPR